MKLITAHKSASALLVTALVATGATAQEKPKEPEALSKTVVTDVVDPNTAPNAVIATAKLAQIAGAVKVVDSSAVERGRVGTQADILAFQPGVFAAAPGGSGDGIKLSIRGSAIARSAGNFFRAGTLFSFDGLPVTGAGGTPYELFETYGLNYTEVLIGGNAYDYGALQLGGAINYVTKTGRTASPIELRADVGSFGYRKYQASSGGITGKTDYFFSAAALKVQGYQQHTRGEAFGVAGNVGYEISPEISTRFYLRWRRTENENGGALSLAEINSDSSVANPNQITNDTYRTQPGSTWIANKTTFKVSGDSNFEFGVVYHDAPIDINPKPSSGNFNAPQADAERSIWNFRDVTVQSRYTQKHTLFGLDSTTTIFGAYDDEFNADVEVYANNANVTTGARAYKKLIKIANYDGSADASLRAINQLSVTNDLTITTGLGLAYVKRAGEVTYFSPEVTPLAPAPGALGRKIDRDNYYFVPRFGTNYKLGANANVFANVTRSVEGPNSWQLNRGSTGNYQYHDPIRDQKAWAFEIGTRFTQGIFTGSASVFHTDVKDELLTIAIVPGDPSKGSYTLNADKTRKEGVELGLDTTLWSSNGFLTAATDNKGSKLVFDQSLALNRFKYRNDVTFGNNQLPGVPRQYYQARLQYDHSSGFYASASVQYASRYYADFRNQFETPAYVLLGATVGYEAPNGRWQVYLDGRNLTDKNYVSSANPTFDAGGNATNRFNRIFQPGDGVGITGGVIVRF